MERNQNKRQQKHLEEIGETIGNLLGLEKVPTFNMAWKEPRLNLPGGGECYPLVDVLKRLAERVHALTAKPAMFPEPKVVTKPSTKKERTPKKQA